jgi:putative transposase
VKTVTDTLGVARSNLAVPATAAAPRRRRGRPPQPEAGLLTEIREAVAGQPTYGYRRVHALIRRSRREQGGAAVNVKRVYRIMKAHRPARSAWCRARRRSKARNPTAWRKPL